jgi:hypothetical protein
VNFLGSIWRISILIVPGIAYALKVTFVDRPFYSSSWPNILVLGEEKSPGYEGSK